MGGWERREGGREEILRVYIRCVCKGYLLCMTCTCTCTVCVVQSRVAAGFSWFSKNIPKPFLTYNVACMLCSVAP